MCGVPYKAHGDRLDAWQRAWNAQFHYLTHRLAEAAWPGRRVVEYARAGGYRGIGLLHRAYASRYDGPSHGAWEEDAPLWDAARAASA
ncbi:hypothetical protein ACFY7Y_25870 [Streptomyces virginiae]|uniref:hypothetical protein n=1 Tax=Streptomyces virginiae TaxID=1961 RepID=UPI0036875D16